MRKKEQPLPPQAELDGWDNIGGIRIRSGMIIGDFVRYTNNEGRLIYGIIRDIKKEFPGVNCAIEIEFQNGIKDWVVKNNSIKKYKSLELFDPDNGDLSPPFVQATQDMVQKFILKKILKENE